MEENRTYTIEEVRYLIDYTQSIVFEAIQTTMKKDKPPFEDISRKLLRKWGQLFAFPDIVLEKRPKNKPEDISFPLKIHQRELLYKVLGNTSNRVTSLDDPELIIETLTQLKHFK